MRIREKGKETLIQTFDLCHLATNKRWELIMIPNKDKRLCKAKRPHTRRHTDLGGLVHDAIIKPSLTKQLTKPQIRVTATVERRRYLLMERHVQATNGAFR